MAVLHFLPVLLQAELDIVDVAKIRDRKEVRGEWRRIVEGLGGYDLQDCGKIIYEQ